MMARTASGDIAIPMSVVNDVGIVSAQKATDSFNLWQGAWFANTLEGFPWLKILGQPANGKTLSKFRSLFRNALLQVPAVVAVTELAASVGKSRQLAYKVKAPLNNGQILVGGSGAPFIVTGASGS